MYKVLLILDGENPLEAKMLTELLETVLRSTSGKIPFSVDLSVNNMMRTMHAANFELTMINIEDASQKGNYYSNIYWDLQVLLGNEDLIKKVAKYFSDDSYALRINLPVKSAITPITFRGKQPTN